MPHQTVYLVGNIAALLFIYLISIPAITYNTYQFYKHKSNSIMKHRDVPFVLSLNCLIIFGLVTQRTLMILSDIDAIHFYHILVQRIFTGITVWGTIDLVCVKSYLLFFQHRYHLSIQNASWKQCIDSSWNDWYLQNKNRWGQFAYIIRWLLIPFTLTVVIECLGSEVLGWLGMFIFHMISAFVPIVLVIIFSFRLRTFYDIYGIRKEIISQWSVLVICAIVYFIATYAINALCNEHEKYIVSVFGNGVIIISFSFIGFSSVYYPLYLLRHQAIHQEKTAKRVHLLSAIRDPTMLSLFMQHSVTEFNTENLLFIIETVQIKHAYQMGKNHVIQTSNRIHFVTDELKQSSTLVLDFNDFTVPNSRNPDAQTEYRETDVARQLSGRPFLTTYLLGNGGCVKIEIPSELPTSNVLTEHPNDIKLQMAALYPKYVADGSCLEINIPFELKQELLSLMRTEKSEAMVEGDWFCVMDQTCLHILTLLIGPFNRFQKRTHFGGMWKAKNIKLRLKRLNSLM